VPDIKNTVPFKNDMFGLCPIQKNGAIQKDLIADNEWSPYKCRCDIFVVWAPLSSLLLTCLSCGRHRTEKEQISLLPVDVTSFATHLGGRGLVLEYNLVIKDYYLKVRGLNERFLQRYF
jgi:hypothetical protein